VKEFMLYWLNEIVKHSVKPSTYANYVYYNSKWITPYLGEKKLYQLKGEEVQQFVNELVGKGLSAGSVKNIYRVLMSVMKKAKQYGYMREHPCKDIMLPEYKRQGVKVLSQEDQQKLEQVSKAGGTMGTIVMLALYTGLRIGEICALTVGDIDFTKGELTVSKTRQRIQYAGAVVDGAKTGVVTGSAKSDSSERLIPLPPFLLVLLKNEVKANEGESIFSYQGRALEPRVIQYRFKRLLKRAGIDAVHFHVLRHTFVTRCLEQNIDVKTISELVGHSSAKITLDLYGHSRLEQKQLAMKHLQKLHLSF
jgi:integrase